MAVAFVSKGRPNSRPFRGTPTKEPPPGDNLVQCLKAMDAAVRGTPVVDELGPPILPCMKPWLEVTLFDRDDRPVPGAPYDISLPGGQRRSGVLDDTGFIHIDDIDADATQLMARVDVRLDEKGDVERYEITVVSKEEARAPSDAEEATDTDSPFEERAEFLIV